ncbi:MAG: DUF192 domain-containing protein [Patescibacteria group bacterium]
MEKTLFLLFLLVFLWFGWGKLWPKKEAPLVSDLKIITIGNTSLSVEVAVDNEAITRGLSGREKLAEKAGLLFVFPAPGYYPFWMKEMRFPIDIIWIGADKKVVGFSENILPESYPATFAPPSPVQYVVEVNAGWVEERGILVGDILTLSERL